MVQEKAFPNNLVLDLDDVVLHSPTQELSKEHQFFLETSFLPKDSYGYNYIVPAYLPEFLKFATSRFNVAFFSGGEGERNRSVVQDIWMQVFKTDTPATMQVLCRKSLTSAWRDDELQPESSESLGYWRGDDKKDIRKIGELHNTILVDDNQSWVVRGQKPNFLKVDGMFFDSIGYYVELFLSGKGDLECIFPFYKLVYVTGMLDKAAHHPSSTVEGLYALQFEGDQPKFYERIKDIDYYKRGYKVLSTYSEGTLYPYFPQIENLFLQEK